MNSMTTTRTPANEQTEQADFREWNDVSSQARDRPAFSFEWAAGFVDGEACIHVARQTYRTNRTPNFRLRVCITQNDRAVLEHFKNGIDVPACLVPVKAQRWHSQPVFTLNYDGEHALNLLVLVLPHLIRKRAEAQAGIQFWFEGGVGKHRGSRGVPPDVVAIRESFYRKLRALKRAGPPSVALA